MNNSTKKAIWFSRHQPSREQIEDAARMGYVFVAVEEGLALGTLILQTDDDVVACANGLINLCAKTGAVAIFGVFATPILGVIGDTAMNIALRGDVRPPENGMGDYPCFAAWNISRPQEGGKPSFTHKKWVLIGHISQIAINQLE